MSEKEKGGSSLDIFDHLGTEASKQDSVSSGALPPAPPTSTALIPESDPAPAVVPPPPPSVVAASARPAPAPAALTPASPSVAPVPTSTPPASVPAAPAVSVSAVVPASAEVPSSKLPGSAVDTLVAHLADPQLDLKADPKKTILGLPASGPPPSGSVPRLPAPPPSVRPSVPSMPAASVRPSQSGMAAAIPAPPPSVRPPLPSVRAMAAVKLPTTTLLGTPSSTPAASTQSQPVPPAAPSTSRALDLDPQVDMEWDDEEATHVFDNKQHRGPLSSPPPVTKSSPPALPASARSTPPSPTQSVRPAHIPATPPSVKPSSLPSAAPAAASASAAPAKVIPTAPATERTLEAPATHSPRSETMPPARVVEAQGNATRGLILGLIAAIVAGGALMYTLTPKRGTLRIEVSSADGRNLDRIDGMVDGKHECDTAPCLVKNLDSGEHVVKVFANGYDKPEEQSIKTSGDETRVSIVLRSPIRKASVHLGAAPAGAKVVLLGGDERREVTTFPSDVKDLDPKVAWTVVGTLSGAPELRMPLSLSAGETREVLLPFAATPEASSAAHAVQPAPQPAAAPRAAAAPAPAAAAAPRAAAEPAAAPAAPVAEAIGPATLNLNSIPASNVVLDGTPLGTTPKLGVSVTSGKHTVLFINSDLDLRKKVEIVVKPGETKTVAQKLTP